ncbi:hypothetical protein L1987_13696 [Smallanthus sonchifolius]|uniref:Uncharacterized protein n=1 Tax=Smallanthus sonchifolius TaxID=185202 RepID=A0ACB9JI34_9ASTR|nr:hypothetical protein L1987_13696 [Smallanthus sonchifolius]
MIFTLDAADELGIPEVLFWTTSACGFLVYAHYNTLRENGFIPLKVDCIPSMKGMRLKDMPTFLKSTNPNEVMVNFCIRETARAKKASAIILNTFDELEHEVLTELSSIYPYVFSIGPLHTIANSMVENDVELLGSSLWKEDKDCL